MCWRVWTMSLGLEKYKVVCQACLHTIFCNWPPTHCPKCKAKFNKFTPLEHRPVTLRYGKQ